MQEINFFICPSKKSLRNVQNQIKIKKFRRTFFSTSTLWPPQSKVRLKRLKMILLNLSKVLNGRQSEKKALLDLLRSTEKKWANLTFCHKLFWTLDTTSKFTKRIICLKEFTVYTGHREAAWLICHLQYLSVNYVRWTTKDLVGSSKMLWSSSSKMYLKHLQN